MFSVNSQEIVLAALVETETYTQGGELPGHEGTDTQPLNPHQFTLTHGFLGSAIDSVKPLEGGLCTAEQSFLSSPCDFEEAPWEKAGWGLSKIQLYSYIDTRGSLWTISTEHQCHSSLEMCVQAISVF